MTTSIRATCEEKWMNPMGLSNKTEYFKIIVVKNLKNIPPPSCIQ